MWSIVARAVAMMLEKEVSRKDVALDYCKAAMR